MVYGVAKSGKTTWIVHEALHMAAEGHRVLYIDGEMGIGDFQARLSAVLAGAQIPDGFRVLSSRALGRNLQLETSAEQIFILREAKDGNTVRAPLRAQETTFKRYPTVNSCFSPRTKSFRTLSAG